MPSRVHSPCEVWSRAPAKRETIPQKETKARLNIITQTNDGFVIAEKDLQIRGPGEFLGTRLSGLPDMIIADLVSDSKTLEEARSEAIKFVKEHNIDDYPLLKNAKGLNFDGDIFNS